MLSDISKTVPDLMNRLRKSKLPSSTSTTSSSLMTGEGGRSYLRSHYPSSATTFNHTSSYLSHNSSRPTSHLWDRKQKDRLSSQTPQHECRCKDTHINQEIISIKTYLLKLKRILQDETNSNDGLSDGIASLESLNSLDNGPSLPSQSEEVQDLKRQIVYLQQMNEDKDRQIRDLQSQLERSSLSPTKSKLRGKLTNAATQTERAPRPVSCGYGLSGSSSSSINSNTSTSAASKTIDGRKVRRSRTPLPRRIIHCSDDGTLRIPIKPPTQL